METHVKISQNVLAELSRLALECSPTLSTARGDLYPADNVPLGAIRLNVSRTDYLAYLASLPSEERPSARLIVPVDNLPFDIVVNGFISIDANGRTAINGKTATIL
jgi:hypothetical protein